MLELSGNSDWNKEESSFFFFFWLNQCFQFACDKTQPLLEKTVSHTIWYSNSQNLWLGHSQHPLVEIGPQCDQTFGPCS